MNLASWNVNGLRACMNKGFMDFFARGFDILALQEIKMLKEQGDFDFGEYHEYWNPAVKKGYSGTLVLTQKKPHSAEYNMPGHETEGRIITLEYDDFYFVNVYTPNSQRELARLAYRMDWEDDFRAFLCEKAAHKPLILCGDLNVAHNEIDLKNPKTNQRNAGFTIEERQKMSALLDAGFVDSYRHLYPEKENAYTWWSYMSQARARNIGWRIDYFLVSAPLREHIEDALIYPEIMGSDHCPVGILLN